MVTHFRHIAVNPLKAKKNVPPFPTGRLIHMVMPLYFESVILMVFEKV
jgi:hypothetical protein